MPSPEQIIEQWMLCIIEDGGIARLDDLHIDEIDDKWKSKRLWIEGGLEAYRLALNLREKHRLQYILALGFSLKSGRKMRGVNFSTLKELATQLDWSPPSLYLLEPDFVFRSRSGGAGRNLHLFDDFPGADECHFCELLSTADQEYRRSILVVGYAGNHRIS